MAKKERRKFSKQYKLEAVRLIEERGLTAASEALGVTTGLLCNWRKALASEGADAFRGNGNRTALEEENRRLRLEVQELKLEREFLKKASAYFAKSQK